MKHIPHVPSSIPRRGSKRSRRFVRALFFRLGWRFEGDLPDCPKFVMIGAPHTSNWDFFLGMAVIFGLGLDFKWIGKHTLFRWPLRFLLRWAGGIPVNRNRPGGIIFEAVREYERHDTFVVGLSPEGTRSKVARWKAGFHRLARGAEVPILPAFVDYKRKVVGFGPLFQPGEDRDADLRRLQDWYRQFSPRKPAQY